ncbi:Efr3 protein [Saccharomycopsis crataegensis]|uniref:Protein EFR3 n=1 Tax=Saccharomycopsis crataegensis TaxID=43959 RepID=A0AAV5QDP8_9ASCO|nr:Efr3 protein [Saccharomycopsis crataegensis]
MPLIKSKHQKLILQCYPSGRDVDKKPNSSELSYLLYYVSTRRVKLEKVGTFLEKKTFADLHHFSHYGNVQVSLLILKNLIEKCSENLNVFAGNCVNIFHQTLLSKDLILTQTTLKVFKVFCNHLDENLFVGDRELITKFIDTSELFLDLANSKLANSAENNQWKIIAIKAAKYLSNIAGFNLSTNGKNTENVEQIVNQSLGLILSVLHQNFSTEQLEERLDRVESKAYKRNDLSLSKSRTNVSFHGSISGARSVFDGVARDNTTEDNVDLDTEWSDADCAEDALIALQTYFSSAVSSELNISLRAVDSFIKSYANNTDMKNWTNYLIQIIVNYAPVQLRFLVLTILINRLSRISDIDGAVNVPDPKLLRYQIILAYTISGLLNSRANMIGLSVLDILKNLLALQLNAVEWEPSPTCVKDVAEIQSHYVTCISSLSKHIYYHDQIGDIIEEIFIKINDTFASHENVNQRQISILFENIDEILDSGISKSSSQQTEGNDKVDGIETYMGENINSIPSSVAAASNLLYPMIKQKASVYITAWLKFSMYLNGSEIVESEIFEKYYRVLIKLLVIELGGHDEAENFVRALGHANADDFNNNYHSLSNQIRKLQVFKSERPNYDNLILDSLRSNFLDELLKNFDKILVSVDNENLCKYILIVKVLVLEIFGINFIYNILRHFLNWQTSDFDDDKAKLRDSFAYSLLLKSGQYLYLKFQKNANTVDEQSPNPFDELIEEVSKKIKARLSNDLWHKKIPVFIRSSTATSDLFFTEDSLMNFFDSDEITHRWIVDVFNGQHPSFLPPEDGHQNNFTHEKILENASVLSASRLAANLTIPGNTTLLSSSGFTSFNNLKSTNTGTMFKVNDLKSVVSKSNLLDSSPQNKLEEVDIQKIQDGLHKMLDGLCFNNESASSTKLNLLV